MARKIIYLLLIVLIFLTGCKKEEEKDANFDSSVLTGDLFLFLNKENEQKEEEL